jgi:hypothetical protein
MSTSVHVLLRVREETTQTATTGGAALRKTAGMLGNYFVDTGDSFNLHTFNLYSRCPGEDGIFRINGHEVFTCCQQYKGRGASWLGYYARSHESLLVVCPSHLIRTYTRNDPPATRQCSLPH